jgi:hypothetical protein
MIAFGNKGASFLMLVSHGRHPCRCRAYGVLTSHRTTTDRVLLVMVFRRDKWIEIDLDCYWSTSMQCFPKFVILTSFEDAG